MRNVWDYLEIGLLKMLFSDAAAMSHYLQSFRTVVARASDSYTDAMEMYGIPYPRAISAVATSAFWAAP